MIYIGCTLEIYRDNNDYFPPCHTANQKMKEIYIYIVRNYNNVFIIYKRIILYLYSARKMYTMFFLHHVTLHVHSNY